MNALKNEDIPSMIYYRLPLHLQKVFEDLKYYRGDFPVTEEVADRIFSLPMHPYLKTKDQNRILKVLNNV
jgi:UDP-2-acetamido-2-deoxy-ribo-hexuluronate aminotransferase